MEELYGSVCRRLNRIVRVPPTLPELDRTRERVCRTINLPGEVKTPPAGFTENENEESLLSAREIVESGDEREGDASEDAEHFSRGVVVGDESPRDEEEREEQRNRPQRSYSNVSH